jgi:glycerol-3-phosphate acyltransferase PlsX
MKIGLDVMGGDFAPDATVAGAILALSEISENDQVVLLGNEEVIHDQLNKYKVGPENFQIVHTSQVIGMGEAPQSNYHYAGFQHFCWF